MNPYIFHGRRGIGPWSYPYWTLVQYIRQEKMEALIRGEGFLQTVLLNESVELPGDIA